MAEILTVYIFTYIIILTIPFSTYTNDFHLYFLFLYF